MEISIFQNFDSVTPAKRVGCPILPIYEIQMWFHQTESLNKSGGASERRGPQKPFHHRCFTKTYRIWIFAADTLDQDFVWFEIVSCQNASHHWNKNSTKHVNLDPLGRCREGVRSTLPKHFEMQICNQRIENMKTPSLSNKNTPQTPREFDRDNITYNQL